MEWCIQHINPISNLVGLLFDMIGAWLVAWEVVKQYNGPKYEPKNIPSRNIQSTARPEVTEHPDYKTSETNKYRKMKWGLGCLTTGFIIQMLPNVCQIIFH